MWQCGAWLCYPNICLSSDLIKVLYILFGVYLICRSNFYSWYITFSMFSPALRLNLNLVSRNLPSQLIFVFVWYFYQFERDIHTFISFLLTHIFLYYTFIKTHMSQRTSAQAVLDQQYQITNTTTSVTSPQHSQHHIHNYKPLCPCSIVWSVQESINSEGVVRLCVYSCSELHCTVHIIHHTRQGRYHTTVLVLIVISS